MWDDLAPRPEGQLAGQAKQTRPHGNPGPRVSDDGRCAVYGRNAGDGTVAFQVVDVSRGRMFDVAVEQTPPRTGTLLTGSAAWVP